MKRRKPNNANDTSNDNVHHRSYCHPGRDADNANNNENNKSTDDDVKPLNLAWTSEWNRRMSVTTLKCYRSVGVWIGVTLVTIHIVWINLNGPYYPALSMTLLMQDVAHDNGLLWRPPSKAGNTMPILYNVPETIVFQKLAGQGNTNNQFKNYSLDNNAYYLNAAFDTDSRRPDYGGLKLARKQITPTTTNYNHHLLDIDTDYQMAEQYREDVLKYVASLTSDRKRDQYEPESDKVDMEQECRKANWVGYSFPSCNRLHELVLDRVWDTHGLYQPYNVTYLNSGSYRQAWRFQSGDEIIMDHVVMKRSRMSEDSEWSSWEYYHVSKEALLLERLLPSPNVVNIYGYCGTTVLSEAMSSDVQKVIITKSNGVISHFKLEKLDNVYPRNNLTTSEKLQIALDMAEGLASLHGYKGGCITLGDTHIEEFLISPKDKVKLNDLNLALEPEWDEKAGMYCEHNLKYRKTHRSPEEYLGASQDESVDTYAYGNMIYSTLIGLWPFYHERDAGVPNEKIRTMIIMGRRPFIDPRYKSRSFIEGKLVEVIEKCWAHDRKQRPSMFYIVSFLRDVKREAAKRGELETSNLLQITF